MIWALLTCLAPRDVLSTVLFPPVTCWEGQNQQRERERRKEVAMGRAREPDLAPNPAGLKDFPPSLGWLDSGPGVLTGAAYCRKNFRPRDTGSNTQG